ncbi:CASP-like protein 4U1 [Panicum virgatum]|uniref:CASP-like protein n=1 Tax=Panicum virgatum TaxID=38727 RepID=A0A8T0PBQ7_PANVG|nr:CASP-like protein 4U1 [Panicum virgatum]KAG2559253.1 hypothetical protein PVAP13_8NG288800 [Panicum virgatum]
MRLDSATKCCTTFPALNSAQTEKSFPRSFSSYHVLCSKLILSPQTHHGRYTVGVNVIVSFYSIAQAFVETRRLISPWLWSTSCYCISLVLDQVLAYLLMSASSAAASRNHLRANGFAMDRFRRNINAAVWFSFLGFLALAAHSLISMANLFSRI